MFDDQPCDNLDGDRRQREERDALIVRLSLEAPLRSTAPQADSGHLPLFVSANEPTLF